MLKALWAEFVQEEKKAICKSLVNRKYYRYKANKIFFNILKKWEKCGKLR